MFDLSSGKLILIGVIALVVVGPKELPGLLRQVGRALTKLRTMAGEFRQQFDEAMREAELDDVAKVVTDVKGGLASTVGGVLDPVTKLPGEIGAAATIGDLSTSSGTGSAATATGGVSLDLPLPPEPPPIALPGADAKPAEKPAEPKPRTRRKTVPEAEPAPEASSAGAPSAEAAPVAAEAVKAKPAAKGKPAVKAKPAKTGTTEAQGKAGTAKPAASKAASASPPVKTSSAKAATKPKTPRRSKAAVSEEGA
jgi:sec-independent protein translocase protein TatB